MKFAVTARRNEKPAQGPRVLGPWLIDASAWAVGLAAAIIARFDMEIASAPVLETAIGIVVAVVLHTLIGHQQFLYRGRYGFGTFEEVRAVFVTVLAVVVALFGIQLCVPGRPLPLSAAFIGGPVALVVMLGVRYLRRLQYERRLRPDARATPVLLFGAGVAGQRLLRSLLHDPNSRYVPVGLIDDDPDKRHLRVNGVPVRGNRRDIPDLLASTGARTVIFAVANVDAALIREIRAATLQSGADFKVVPSVGELLNGTVTAADVRDVNISDLLGRHQIDTDLDAIADYLKGKRVLVTGAGGSIGSELCRQLDRFDLAELMMLDRDESALHAVQLSLRGRALLDSPELILADLRDEQGIATVFAERRPQVVFHAAALKHLSLLESHPGEAIKSNVWGTQTVLQAAAAAGVERFVNISTDKAANPGCVLGYSKRITERLTAHASTVSDGTYLSVRFGNVLGSRGSVLTAFASQIAAGGPITVTDPEVTRYFMTVQEAVQLVIQAAAIGRDGEALVLEMGKPVSIAQVARQMSEQANSPVEIVYTGLRPGEKLHEELFGDGERDTRPFHPLISHVGVPTLNPYAVRLLDPYSDHRVLVKEMAALCHGMSPAKGTAHIARQSRPADMKRVVAMAKSPNGA